MHEHLDIISKTFIAILFIKWFITNPEFTNY